MAENQSKNKNNLIEALILLFAVVAMGLLIVQISINTLDTIEGSLSDSEPTVTRTVPAMTNIPTGPTPTFDYSDVELNDSN